MMRSLVVPVFFLLGAVTIHAAGEPGIVKGTDQFEFIYRVKLPEIKGDARVWIPLAKTDAFQTVTQEELNIPMKWKKFKTGTMAMISVCYIRSLRTAARRSSCDIASCAKKKQPTTQ